MSEKFKNKPASPQELSLYCLIGEAVCMVQHLEDGLSHSIVMKKVERHLKLEADKLLEKHRKYTLGKAIGILEKSGLYHESLLRELREILLERNWLIHKSIAQNREEWDQNISREQNFIRIKTITTQARNLLQKIEEDMMNYAEANGADLSRVRDEIIK